MNSTSKEGEAGGRQGRDRVDTKAGRTKPRPIRWLVPSMIALLTIAAFLPALENGFVNWDDDKNIYENPHYRGLGLAQLSWMFTTFHMSLYRPLTWITLGLDYLVWGMEPFGYHLTNLFLHAANAILFYFLTLRLLALGMSSPVVPGELALRISAGFAALVFAIHPLRVESAAWASARNDVLSGMFFLGAVLCYLRAATALPADRTRRWWTTASVIIYALSLLAKAIGITLPIILLVLDVYPLRRLGGNPRKWLEPGARHILWEKTPFLLLAVGAGVIALLAKEEYGVTRSLGSYGIIPRLAQSAYGLAFYLWKTALPLGLSPLYELPQDFTPWDSRFLLAGVAVLAVSIGLFAVRRRWPAGLALWVCYVVSLAPVLGIAQSGPQIVADRYSYLSCLGWAVLAGAGLFYCWQAWFRVRVFVLAAGLASIVVLGVLTWKQTQVWHDSERLWRHVLTIDQNSSYAHYNLALLLDNQGLEEESIEHYRQAVRFDPVDTNAHNNLGLLLMKRGEFEEAIEHFRQALKIAPADVGFHINLALALVGQGNLEEAVKHFRRSLELSPTRGEAYNIQFSLGHALARQGRFSEAEAHFREAIRIQPEFAEAHEDLGRALARQGKIGEAVKHYQEALRILKSRPKDSSVR